jgi:AcrR family transcriptional regulator
MEEEDKRTAKERIFDAAVALFARKGFAAVGTREIAKSANVNVSMINYYFGGKVGMLKAIINKCYDRYFHAVLDTGDENTTPAERVRLMVRNLVQFFKTHTELSVAAFNTFLVDIPEIVNLRIKWLSGNREATNKIFTQFGLDTDDTVQMSVVQGVLTSIIATHFQGRYAWEYVMQAPDQSKSSREYIKREPRVELDETFCDRYSAMLSDFYLSGLRSIVARNPAAKGKAAVRGKKRRGGRNESEKA